ncbi:MAG: prepilin-type N-terminal cleavage/methylation domain-containing protein [Sulfuricaulis sp.]|nr:prepilin-type N-terminal cleavage/methylation domain-containing protein [Sulfuricaulis sp.]
MTTAQHHRGFTMIEVAVVMLLIVIVLGMVNLRLSEDDATKLRYEAKRMAMFLQSAMHEAIFQGQTIHIMIEPEGYYFTDANSEPIETEGLRKVPLPPGMKFSSLVINGDPVEIDDVSNTKNPPYIIVPATGEVPPFIVILKLGKDRWQLESEFGGNSKDPVPVPNDEDLNG